MEHNDIVLVEAKDQGQLFSTTNLYLTGMVNDHDILAIGHCGPSLEHVFNQLGRQFFLKVPIFIGRPDPLTLGVRPLQVHCTRTPEFLVQVNSSSDNLQLRYTTSDQQVS